MKLDTESIYAHSTLSSKPDSQNFHYGDTIVETAQKANNDIPVEDKMKVVSDTDIEKHENNTTLHTPDKIEEDRNKARVRDLKTVGTSVNGGKKENDDPFYSNRINSFEDESELYTDKNVTEVELPKESICPEDDDGEHHTVKDICIDDGFPSPGRVLVENGEIHDKVTFNSVYLDSDLDNGLSRVNVENPVPILNDTNPFTESESKLDDTNDYSFEILNQNSEEDTDKTINLNSAVSSGFNRTNPFLECDSESELHFANTSFPENFKLDYENSTGKGDKISYADVDGEVLILTRANPFLESGSEAEVAERSFPESLVGKEEEGSDATANLVSDEKTSRVTLPWMSDPEQSDQDTSSDVHAEESIMPTTAEETIDDAHRTAHSASSVPCIAEETNDDTSGGTHSANSVLPSTAEETNDHASRAAHSASFMPSTVEETTDDRNREAHSAKSIMPSTAEETNDHNNQAKAGGINYNVDSSSPAPSGSGEDLKSTESQPAHETLCLPSIGEEMVDSRTASSRSFFIQHGYGETSFSTSGPLSGPIAFSGPISNSGSTSLRSESSTTSARSFAFPVLSTEWISSPVKMAKADRKHIRKQRGWLLSLLCCRF